MSIANFVSGTVIRSKGNLRQDFPVVVGVVVRVPGDLLALTGDTAVIISKRVAVRVTV